jgi:anti-sigma-K factor RskA
LYALGALEAGACAPVVEHVAGCADCARELAEYQFVAEGLADSLPLSVAPTELEERVLAAISTLPPAEASARRPRWEWPLRWEKGARLAVALLALLVFFLGGLTLRLSRELAETRIELARVTEALTAADLRPVVMVGEPDQAPAAYGRFLYTEGNREATLIVEGLPELPQDRAYQLWLVGKDGTRDNGGLFRPDREGEVRHTLQAPRPWSEYSALGVTIEPRSGSPGPTGPRVLRSEGP